MAAMEAPTGYQQTAEREAPGLSSAPAMEEEIGEMVAETVAEEVSQEDAVTGAVGAAPNST